MRALVPPSLVVVLCLAAACRAYANDAPPRPADDLLPTSDAIAALAASVCDAELGSHVSRSSYKEQWCEAVLYMGVLSAHELTSERRFLEAARDWCEEREWRLGPRPRHADDLSPAQVYLSVWSIDGDPVVLERTTESFNRLLADPLPGREEWSWCDALFMAPPAMAMLADATGERAYADAMNDMWWDAVDHLYDSERHLFHRDAQHKTLSRNTVARGGPELFWGRGNGWVMAGTTRVLDALPSSHPSRAMYESLLSEMAEAVAAVQGDDGLWRPSLLEPAEGQAPDTSCSALFACAIAWGLAEGLLPQDPFLDVVARAWAGLGEAVDASGRLGWVQSIGAAPGAVRATDRADFGTGAFLLAALQVARVSDGLYPQAPLNPR